MKELEKLWYCKNFRHIHIKFTQINRVFDEERYNFARAHLFSRYDKFSNLQKTLSENNYATKRNQNYLNWQRGENNFNLYLSITFTLCNVSDLSVNFIFSLTHTCYIRRYATLISDDRHTPHTTYLYLNHNTRYLL